MVVASVARNGKRCAGDQEAVHQPDDKPKPDRRHEYYWDHPVVGGGEAGRDDG
jgi:hypothetical protein